MAAAKIEPDRDHSQKSPSKRESSSVADLEKDVTFDSGLFKASPWSFSSTSHPELEVPASKADPQEHASSNISLMGASLKAHELQEPAPEVERHLAPRTVDSSVVDTPSRLTPMSMDLSWYYAIAKDNAQETTTSQRFTSHGLQFLKTTGLKPHATFDLENGLLTPNTTTPSTGTHRWTPPSALDSATTASSASNAQFHARLNCSPTESFTPHTYAHQTPWNSSGEHRMIPFQHQVSPCVDQSVRSFDHLPADFGSQTQRQLFKSTTQIPTIALNDQEANRNPGFRPMDALLSSAHHQHNNPFGSIPFDHTLDALRNQYLPSFSSRYCGKHVDSNASADHLLPDQNCALWLTNLPPNVTYTQLLGSIRHFGRIWCTYINEPNHREHVTAAAKVVFFSPRAASAFVHAAWSSGPAGPHVLAGYHIKVAHNRIKYPEKSYAQGESRVLIITGQPRFVNEDSLFAFFQQRFIFQTDRVRTLVQTVSRAVVEFSFGSYRCQAQMGMMALEKDRPAGFEKVEYGEDPCEVGDTYSSYKIAVDRVRGMGL